MPEQLSQSDIDALAETIGKFLDTPLDDSITKKDSNTLKRIRVEKLEDTAFLGDHPNGINVGYVREGFMYAVPHVGDNLILYPSKMMKFGEILSSFRTSSITKIEPGKIHTRNSVYAIFVEVLDEVGIPHWEPYTA